MWLTIKDFLIWRHVLWVVARRVRAFSQFLIDIGFVTSFPNNWAINVYLFRIRSNILD